MIRGLSVCTSTNKPRSTRTLDDSPGIHGPQPIGTDGLVESRTPPLCPPSKPSKPPTAPALRRPKPHFSWARRRASAWAPSKPCSHIYNKGSTVFVVGRSESRFAATLARLRDLDPSAGLTFLEAQVSLLHDVDRVCAIVAEQIDTLEILWLSQGGLGLRENNGSTSEGLPVDFAVSYYGRVRFMQRLAPLLSKSPNGRVISVLCAGMEGSVNAADPGLRDSGNYAAAGFWGAQKQGVTMQSLAMQTLAAQNPAVTFIHTNPGAVSSEVHAKWSQAYTGWWTPVSWLITAVLVPLMRVVGFTPEQAGETGLFAALDETLGRKGAGWNFFRVNERADDVGKKGAAVLAKYREDGTSEKIWEHTLGVFDRILAG